MKKIITLLVVLATLCAGTIEAQVLRKSSAKGTMTTVNNRRAAIEAGESQTWWGYIGNTTDLGGVGLGKADTYHCAMFLSGQDDMTSAKKICALRFALTASHATDVKVWLASELPASDPTADNTLWVKDVATSELGEAIDVALDTPYEISKNGVFVGYSFTITSASTTDDQYPVLTGGSDHPYGLLLRTNATISNWGSLYGQNFGVLAMKVLMEGEFAQNCVVPSFATSTYYAQIGQSANVDLTLTNNGQKDVSSISYTIDNGAEQTYRLNKAMAPGQSGYITISVPADAVMQSSAKTLTVTKVNGEANESLSPSAQFTLNTLERYIQRNVVVEEFTGTGCGWCPRGLIGMEKMRETFGDRFIGIGIHQYNSSDAMYIANYPNNFSSAPSCMIDRNGADIDPYYGTSNDICDDFRTAMNIPTTVDVNVSGVVNEEETEVVVTATIEPLFDTSDYRIEYVLIGDGLKGTTTAWKQSNYYASSVPEEEDLQIFGRGGKYGQSSIVGYVFNDVALAWAGGSQVEALGQLTGGKKHTVSHTLTLPTKATLRTALKKGVVYAAALIVNADGTIANAAKAEVVNAAGISSVQPTDSQAVAGYSLNGTKLQTPQRGINIVRMADGSVHKVMVR